MTPKIAALIERIEAFFFRPGFLSDVVILLQHLFRLNPQLLTFLSLYVCSRLLWIYCTAVIFWHVRKYRRREFRSNARS